MENFASQHGDAVGHVFIDLVTVLRRQGSPQDGQVVDLAVVVGMVWHIEFEAHAGIGHVDAFAGDDMVGLVG